MTKFRFPRPLAFVFSGGLARSAGQIGMCQAAYEFGIVPDLVVGSSTGAINAALFALDPPSFNERATALWSAVGRDRTISSTWRATLRAVSGNGSAKTQAVLRTHLSAQFAGVNHEDLAISFVAVATDLATGQAVEIAGGDVTDSLIASSAFPVVLPAVEHEGRTLIDGAVSATVPIMQALNQGAKSVIVFDTGTSTIAESDLNGIGWYEVLTLAFNHLIRGQAEHDLALAAQRVPVIAITQNEGNPFDLRSATATVALGRQHAASTLLKLVPDSGEGFADISGVGLQVPGD